MASPRIHFRCPTGTGNLRQNGYFPVIDYLKTNLTQLCMVMIKIMETDIRKLKQQPFTAKYVFSENFALDGAELIPVDLGGRLPPHSISINELGKQLLKAAGDGNVDEIRNLMTKGAPFTADWLGTSPLHLAAQNNHLEACEILLRAGISRDARTKVDRTPLHMAAYEGHLEIVECLLKHGADYDSRDLLGMTPLHWAAQNGHAEIVSLLIRYGATTNLANKFELTPSDIALQIKRADIIEVIAMGIRDPLLATQNLALEMNSSEENSESNIISASEFLDTDSTNDTTPIPLETVILEEDSENSVDTDKLCQKDIDSEMINTVDTSEQDDSFNESMKILQQHGITMLPTDDTSILSSVMESGHSVVLTDIGKEVLNSLKTVEPLQDKPIIKIQQVPALPKKKKIITITPEEFLAMTTNGTLTSNNILRQVNGKLMQVPVKPTLKRIVMKKNKIIPISPSVNISKPQKIETVDIESILKQLADAHTQIEEYKIKLMKKEAEVEKYKMQLKAFLEEK